MRKVLYLLFFLTLAGCKNEKKITIEAKIKETPLLTYKVIAEYPHDVSAFTEGFVFHNGSLFESTGSPEELQESQSILGIVDLKTGKIDEKVRLNKSLYFGEGIIFIKNKVFQLTYKNQICFVYDDKSFKKIGEYQFSNKEGWGLTADGTHIIMSDGSDILSYINPDNFQIIKKLPVSENGYAVQNLNELEFIDGYLYANIWTTNYILKIDPSNGKVVGKLDLTHLKNLALQINPNAAETNGIAYDPTSKKILITGKLWPKIYQINFSH